MHESPADRRYFFQWNARRRFPGGSVVTDHRSEQAMGQWVKWVTILDGSQYDDPRPITLICCVAYFALLV